MPAQPWSFFDLLGRRLLETGLGFALLALKDDQCLAGAVFLRWGETLTYKFGASSRTECALQPNYLLFDTAIRWGCDHHCTQLDLGRTDLANAGLRTFKDRWGAHEFPLAYSVMAPASNRHAAGPWLRNLSWFIRHSPPWVARISGEMLYRHFG
jgi:lipid II:glycine glycyltransferase (peptidoglycan interpeptide bridge formation enzyme)